MANLLKTYLYDEMLSMFSGWHYGSAYWGGVWGGVTLFQDG
jgi:hypothetical protein